MASTISGIRPAFFDNGSNMAISNPHSDSMFFDLSVGAGLGSFVLSLGSIVSPPQLSWSIGSITMLLSIIALLSLALAGLAFLNPGTRKNLKASRDHADEWIEAAIQEWMSEGRITGHEAQQLRNELSEPQFHAVLPHFGVHLVISVFLRFPLGSMARFGYSLGNHLLGHLRFALHRIDRTAWQRSNRTHSPLVMLIAAIPGFGAIAYLASKSVRSHPLLLRIGIDAVCQRIPFRLYERSGLHQAIARRPLIADPLSSRPDGVVVHIAPARFTRLLAITATVLVLVDVAVAFVNWTLNNPSRVGWVQTSRVLDLNREASLGTWLTVASLLLMTAIFGAITVWERAAGGRFARHWLGLSLIAGGLSIDEQAQLHDPGGGLGTWARERLPLHGLLYFGWVIFAMLSIVILVLVYRHFLAALPPATRVNLFIGAALYVAGEVGLEMMGGWWIDGHGRDFATDLFTAGEEYLGLMGLIVGIGALLNHIQYHIGDVRISLEPSSPMTSYLEDSAMQAPAAPRLSAGTSSLREARVSSEEVPGAPAQTA